MFSITGLLLVFVCTQNVLGQDVQVTLDKDCYNVGDDSMTLTATYSGSDTISAVIWYFSGRDSQDVIVQTSGCSVFQPDSGFPLARMTYKCPPDTADSNTYQLILSSLEEGDFDSYDWGATFQVASPTNPVVVKKQLIDCPKSTSSSTTIPPTTTATTQPATQSSTPSFNSSYTPPATPTTSDVSSTSTPTTKPSTTTSATSTITSSTPTSTSTTSISTSTTSPSIPASTTSTQSAPSSSSTSSTTRSSAATTTKPLTTPSSGNETTVIIISSVVGGLFFVGIVITIALMLLSQRQKHMSVKHARNHRHHDQDRRQNRRDNQGYPSWQDYQQYHNISYEGYQGMGTKMNPLYVPNRSAYRPEQNYYLDHPSTDQQIYTRNHQISYGGHYNNVRPQTDMHYNQPRYYGGRGGNMISCTLHRDKNNYVAPDYELYW